MPVRFLIIAIWLCLTVLAPSRGEANSELAPEYAEEVEKLKDNFNALKQSFVDGQAKLGEVEEKLAKIRSNERLMANPQVRAALAELDSANVTGKLKGAKTILASFEAGAKQIETSTGDALAKYEEIRGYYDRWNPNSDSPVRPLELLGNGLQKLQDIVTTLDPSPDNILTKPITEFIGFYKESTTAFAGALQRTDVAIRNRRQDCIGTGCGLGSVGGSKDARFNALGTGDSIQMVRRIEPTLGPKGELWANLDGSRTYIYQVSQESVLPGEYWWTSTKGQWFQLKCSSGEFAQVYDGMRMAYGEPATVPTLIARCSRDFAPYREAMARAKSYWPIFASDRDEQWCTGKIFARAGFAAEPGATLTAAGNDMATFVAQYAFRPSVRQKIDRIVPAVRNMSFVRGRLDFSGSPPPQASVNLTLNGTGNGASVGSDGMFEIDLARTIGPEREIGQLSVTASGGDPVSRQVAVERRCEDLGTIAVKLPDQNGESDGELAALAERMVVLRNEAQAIAGRAEALTADGISELTALEQDIARLEATGSGPESAPPDQSAGQNSPQFQRILELSREAYRIGLRIADIRYEIEAQTLNVCEGYERIGAAFDLPSAEVIHTEVSGSQAGVDGSYGEYRALVSQLEALKQQAEALDGTAANPSPSAPDGTMVAQLERLDARLAAVRGQQEQIGALLGPIAPIVAEARSIHGRAQAIDDATLGQTGLGAKSRIAALLPVIVASRDGATGAASALAEKIGAGETALASLRARAESRSAATSAPPATGREDLFAAMNAFNASYHTALTYDAKIEAAAQSSKLCHNAANAMFARRQELDRLARNGIPVTDETATSPEGSDGVSDDAETLAASEEAGADNAETASSADAGPAETVSPVAMSDRTPPDPCDSPEVQAAFARADRAIVSRDRGTWEGAINQIAATGCRNGRLDASMASASAVWAEPSAGSEPPARSVATQDRKKPGLGEVISGVAGIFGAVSSARNRARNPSGSTGGTDVEGLIETMRRANPQPPEGMRSSQSGSATSASTGSPPQSGGQSPRGSDSGGLGALGGAGVVNDPRLAEAMRERYGGSTGTSAAAPTDNYCSTTVARIQSLHSQIYRTSDEKRKLALYNESTGLVVEACRRNCPGVSKTFCDGTAQGWPVSN